MCCVVCTQVVNISLVNYVAGTDAFHRAAAETGVIAIGSVLQGVHVIGVVLISLRLVQKSIISAISFSSLQPRLSPMTMMLLYIVNSRLVTGGFLIQSYLATTLVFGGIYFMVFCWQGTYILCKFDLAVD